MLFVTDEKERVVNCHIGSKFRRFIFESNINTIKSKCETEVNRLFSRFFPYLKLHELEVTVLEDTNRTQGAIEIKIQYGLKSIESEHDKLSIVIG